MLNADTFDRRSSTAVERLLFRHLYKLTLVTAIMLSYLGLFLSKVLT